MIQYREADIKLQAFSPNVAAHLHSVGTGFKSRSGDRLCWLSSFPHQFQLHSRMAGISIVGIPTRYEMDGTGIGSRKWWGIPHQSRPALVPTQIHVRGVQVHKAVGAWRWPSSPPAPRLKTKWNYTSTPAAGLFWSEIYLYVYIYFALRLSTFANTFPANAEVTSCSHAAVNNVFWNVKPCSLVEILPKVLWKCCFHLSWYGSNPFLQKFSKFLLGYIQASKQASKQANKQTNKKHPLTFLPITV
jgi:hypothetical protein